MGPSSPGSGQSGLLDPGSFGGDGGYWTTRNQQWTPGVPDCRGSFASAVLALLLQCLDIVWCESLVYVRPTGFTNLRHCGCTAGSITSFSSLTVLNISGCIKLSTLDDLLIQEYLPAIEWIYVAHCGELLSLPGERFGSFLSLKDLQRGLVLPSTLQRLFLDFQLPAEPRVTYFAGDI